MCVSLCVSLCSGLSFSVELISQNNNNDNNDDSDGVPLQFHVAGKEDVETTLKSHSKLQLAALQDGGNMTSSNATLDSTSESPPPVSTKSTIFVFCYYHTLFALYDLEHITETSLAGRTCVGQARHGSHKQQGR